MMSDYRRLNRANWDDRAPLHADSVDYALDAFKTDPSYLSQVVRFDLPRLGDIRGLRAVHLQCHIGTDTLSLARLGATMTGLDFSPASLAEARKLAEATSTPIDFVESDVYDAVSALGAAQFDLVYTGIGALCWLPDIRRWADTVTALLRPGGRLFIRDGHPILWSIDETRTDALTIGYPYFETPNPTEFTDETTYVTTDSVVSHPTTHEWNHGLGEIVEALLQSDLTLTQLIEHDSVPWEPLPGRMTCDADGEWRLLDHPERLPLTYTLQARKP
ncbi:class I SAM-dependent methyltransferase [Nocardia sp. CDC153]|uniref:class I SAM-dependent methyltransferase n=1 Tax=Nocardia sp. CDC153 TaxID=3112167 RepID=UPI002DBA4033|nr:class I SAM-dependent methyltransferase [Nocardia sp. CDC153]MEC3953001.1 class I SAM-dependent methyltransferase [Nocardia sp. CDC153]